MGEEFDRTTFELKIEPSNDYEKELLNLDTPVIVAIHIWYWKGTELTGYTFGVMSPHTCLLYTSQRLHCGQRGSMKLRWKLTGRRSRSTVSVFLPKMQDLQGFIII